MDYSSEVREFTNETPFTLWRPGFLHEMLRIPDIGGSWYIRRTNGRNETSREILLSHVIKIDPKKLTTAQHFKFCVKAEVIIQTPDTFLDYREKLRISPDDSGWITCENASTTFTHSPMVVGEVYDELHSRLPFKVKGDEKYSDFTFVVGEKQFRTHKIILGSASEVFDKLFSSDMEERKTNQCKVDNIEPDIFEQLLRFIYTGELPADFEDVAMKLYEAAHYYRIKNLIKFCSSAVLNKLNKENAMELYEWSTLYEEEKLRLSAWIIIKRDILEINFKMKEEPSPIATTQRLISDKNFLLSLKK